MSPDAFSGPQPTYGMTQEYDTNTGCDECTCADSLAFARSNKKYKLVVFVGLALVGLILIFDNPDAFS